MGGKHDADLEPHPKYGFRSDIRRGVRHPPVTGRSGKPVFSRPTGKASRILPVPACNESPLPAN